MQVIRLANNGGLINLKCNRPGDPVHGRASEVLRHGRQGLTGVSHHPAQRVPAPQHRPGVCAAGELWPLSVQV